MRAYSLRASSSFRVFSKGSRACYRGGTLVPNARDFSRYPPDAELARGLARIKKSVQFWKSLRALVCYHTIYNNEVYSCWLTDFPLHFQRRKEGVRDSQKNVDEILTESRAIMKEDFFKEHERDHFRGRIELIDKRNKELDEKVTQAERRYFVLKIFVEALQTFSQIISIVRYNQFSPQHRLNSFH